MQLDYISKMSKGKRIPKEEERLTCLLDAMECTGNTRADSPVPLSPGKNGKEPVAMYGRTDPYYPAGCG